ncbi:hypothetical protein EVAR_36471_1 [Eumeta japonica]|uniref:Uncharacterized protein n=1 Tax=Eumeta variegata TaxID=151549 RepID=A0A4C1WRZ1_EUMVA|nr:hypothetical protein EVAR_36471_1 [Eumeta japonica]
MSIGAKSSSLNTNLFIGHIPGLENPFGQNVFRRLNSGFLLLKLIAQSFPAHLFSFQDLGYLHPEDSAYSYAKVKSYFRMFDDDALVASDVGNSACDEDDSACTISTDGAAASGEDAACVKDEVLVALHDCLNFSMQCVERIQHLEKALCDATHAAQRAHRQLDEYLSRHLRTERDSTRALLTDEAHRS